ncbi:ribosome biogenesis protein ytm1 [Bacidia gigantensis]|uniref:ribosome biogenesis protein ytm1 n=1 Tax=Bacidia gigantensis TaxID=2732470 RepID=UPI001D03B4F1|nr:ribosome biogenesis protein ytm1 [Bacidia gigantensis]KAG8525521.1 ribosome biogenesis protein ytm1 [Bacidia gigantensis]
MSNATQVRIQLSTKHHDIALDENPGAILVNTNFRRYALSTLVNTLRRSDQSIPFEFLINGTFLRTSLDEYLTANGISAEATLGLEYVRASLPPVYLASFEHDEWVSSVDVLSPSSPSVRSSQRTNTVVPGQERIVTGSFDGLLRVWNMSSQVLATSTSASNGGHTGSVKTAQFLSATHIASSGLDRCVRIWKYSENSTELASLHPQLELYGHRDPIDSIAVHQSSNRILSASADHTVGFWSTKKSEAPTAPASLLPSSASQGAKRRKVGSSVSTPQRGPLVLLKSHSSDVTDTMFAPNDHTVAYSTSQDHTLKTWDLTTSTCVDTRITSSALLSVAALQSLNLVAAGKSPRDIILIDPRASATTVSAMNLRGHSQAVVSLDIDPDSAYGLVSGSHDGTCRIWDVRSSKSGKDGRVGACTYTIDRESLKDQGRNGIREGVQVFGVCWDKDIGIVSASADKRVQINRGRGMTQAESKQ